MPKNHLGTLTFGRTMVKSFAYYMEKGKSVMILIVLVTFCKYNLYYSFCEVMLL